jgi:hypothetical protein
MDAGFLNEALNTVLGKVAKLAGIQNYNFAEQVNTLTQDVFNTKVFDNMPSANDNADEANRLAQYNLEHRNYSALQAMTQSENKNSVAAAANVTLLDVNKQLQAMGNSLMDKSVPESSPFNAIQYAKSFETLANSSQRIPELQPVIAAFHPANVENVLDKLSQQDPSLNPVVNQIKNGFNTNEILDSVNKYGTIASTAALVLGWGLRALPTPQTQVAGLALTTLGGLGDAAFLGSSVIQDIKSGKPLTDIVTDPTYIMTAMGVKGAFNAAKDAGLGIEAQKILNATPTEFASTHLPELMDLFVGSRNINEDRLARITDDIAQLNESNSKLAKLTPTTAQALSDTGVAGEGLATTILETHSGFIKEKESARLFNALQDAYFSNPEVKALHEEYAAGKISVEEAEAKLQQLAENGNNVVANFQTLIRENYFNDIMNTIGRKVDPDKGISIISPTAKSNVILPGNAAVTDIREAVSSVNEATKDPAIISFVDKNGVNHNYSFDFNRFYIPTNDAFTVSSGKVAVQDLNTNTVNVQDVKDITIPMSAQHNWQDIVEQSVQSNNPNSKVLWSHPDTEIQTVIPMANLFPNKISQLEKSLQNIQQIVSSKLFKDFDRYDEAIAQVLNQPVADTAMAGATKVGYRMERQFGDVATRLDSLKDKVGFGLDRLSDTEAASLDSAAQGVVKNADRTNASLDSFGARQDATFGKLSDSTLNSADNIDDTLRRLGDKQLDVLKKVANYDVQSGQTIMQLADDLGYSSHTDFIKDIFALKKAGLSADEIQDFYKMKFSLDSPLKTQLEKDFTSLAEGRPRPAVQANMQISLLGEDKIQNLFDKLQDADIKNPSSVLESTLEKIKSFDGDVNAYHSAVFDTPITNIVQQTNWASIADTVLKDSNLLGDIKSTLNNFEEGAKQSNKVGSVGNKFEDFIDASQNNVSKGQAKVDAEALKTSSKIDKANEGAQAGIRDIQEGVSNNAFKSATRLNDISDANRARTNVVKGNIQDKVDTISDMLSKKLGISQDITRNFALDFVGQINKGYNTIDDVLNRMAKSTVNVVAKQDKVIQHALDLVDKMRYPATTGVYAREGNGFAVKFDDVDHLEDYLKQKYSSTIYRNSVVSQGYRKALDFLDMVENTGGQLNDTQQLAKDTLTNLMNKDVNVLGRMQSVYGQMLTFMKPYIAISNTISNFNVFHHLFPEAKVFKISEFMDTAKKEWQEWLTTSSPLRQAQAYNPISAFSSATLRSHILSNLQDVNLNSQIANRFADIAGIKTPQFRQQILDMFAKDPVNAADTLSKFIEGSSPLSMMPIFNNMAGIGKNIMPWYNYIFTPFSLAVQGMKNTYMTPNSIKNVAKNIGLTVATGVLLSSAATPEMAIPETINNLRKDIWNTLVPFFGGQPTGDNTLLASALSKVSPVFDPLAKNNFYTHMGDTIMRALTGHDMAGQDTSSVEKLIANAMNFIGRMSNYKVTSASSGATAFDVPLPVFTAASKIMKDLQDIATQTSQQTKDERLLHAVSEAIPIIKQFRYNLFERTLVSGLGDGVKINEVAPTIQAFENAKQLKGIYGALATLGGIVTYADGMFNNGLFTNVLNLTKESFITPENAMMSAKSPVGNAYYAAINLKDYSVFNDPDTVTQTFQKVLTMDSQNSIPIFKKMESMQNTNIKALTRMMQQGTINDEYQQRVESLMNYAYIISNISDYLPEKIRPALQTYVANVANLSNALVKYGYQHGLDIQTIHPELIKNVTEVKNGLGNSK